MYGSYYPYEDDIIFNPHVAIPLDHIQNNNAVEIQVNVLENSPNQLELGNKNSRS